MSHVVTIETQVRDVVAAKAGCRRLRLPQPFVGDVKLFSGTVHGLAVSLKDWRYPAVFDLKTGQGRFDNYNGKWGSPQRLDEFLQAYAVEKATLEARRSGHAVQEQTLEDGSIRLTIGVGTASEGGAT
ncbi:hypothetical protein [Crateriforma conspicua]|uniref:DUF1257 domain-containing protein n=1 Tax=Crateriforma conspicua TaxID=2527996 RepID=A0A5C6FPZ1_9PLAN|nr:hypothetical protein [Crateriforma conspicua]TWU62513.1 hypothetical protein V7x_42480 [Crateriforma conspicua]